VFLPVLPRSFSSGRDRFKTSNRNEAQTLKALRRHLGPAASQKCIKCSAPNANSSHPYENATPFSNLIQMILIFVSYGLMYMFGKMVKDTRLGAVPAM
jgi:K+-transporting ATPase ATPase A chain